MGLGFGGKSFKDFRLWIDDDIETNSYITNEDQIYDDGFLADFHTKKLNIIVNNNKEGIRNMGTRR